jgi:hypothetical protein
MPAAEPPDHHVYNWVSFNRDTFEFYLASVRFYESLLEADVKAVREDEDLRTILGDRALESYPIATELKRVKRVREWFEKNVERGGKDAQDYDVDIAHELFVSSSPFLPYTWNTCVASAKWLPHARLHPSHYWRLWISSWHA